MRTSFILHIDSLAIYDDLSESEIAQLAVAMRDYNNGKEPKLTGLMKPLFNQFKIQFDRDNAKYDQRVLEAKEYGRQGGRGKKKEKG